MHGGVEQTRLARPRADVARPDPRVEVTAHALEGGPCQGSQIGAGGGVGEIGEKQGDARIAFVEVVGEGDVGEALAREGQETGPVGCVAVADRHAGDAFTDRRGCGEWTGSGGQSSVIADQDRGRHACGADAGEAALDRLALAQEVVFAEAGESVVDAYQAAPGEEAAVDRAIAGLEIAAVHPRAKAGYVATPELSLLGGDEAREMRLPLRSEPQSAKQRVPVRPSRR